MSDLENRTSGGPSSAVPADSPLMLAWEAWKKSEAFTNSRKWAIDPKHVDGSLWNAFMTGFNEALSLERERCAAIILAARFDEIERDWRSIGHMIERGDSIDEIKRNR